MTGFIPQISGIGCDCSSNWATTTGHTIFALDIRHIVLLHKNYKLVQPYLKSFLKQLSLCRPFFLYFCLFKTFDLLYQGLSHVLKTSEPCSFVLTDKLVLLQRPRKVVDSQTFIFILFLGMCHWHLAGWQYIRSVTS